MFDCGVPYNECTGSKPGMTQAGAVRRGGMSEFKLHGGAGSARRCVRRYCENDRLKETVCIFLASLSG